MVIRLTRADPGFGLVEMLVVVAILSVLAIGTGLLAFLPDAALPRATDLLIADATEARRHAMLSGLDHALVFSGNGWQVSRRSGDGWSELSTQNVPVVALNTNTPTWELRADGSVSALTLNLDADGDMRRCFASTTHVLECR